MKRRDALAALLASAWVRTAAAHAAPGADIEASRATFEAALRGRAAQLGIPGVAYAVVREGTVALKGAVSADANSTFSTATPLRFASVTKVFTATLLMRAVEQRRLSLDDSAARWLPELRSHPEITVRHLAAHVSEGEPGTDYVYSTSRYAKLGEILRAVFDTPSFEAALRREIFEPAGIPWHPSPDLGAHAALVSTVDDVAAFVGKLQTGALVSAESLASMGTAYRAPAGPQRVGIGWFAQEIAGEPVMWSFGQDDPDHSSALVLTLPRRKLALLMLANTDGLSNPFRLLMGDMRYSPFATAFIDTFAPDLAGGIAPRERRFTDALIAVWRGEAPAAAAHLQAAAKLAPPDKDDLVPHFLAAMAGDEATRSWSEQLDAAVITAHPRNRWALLMSGGLNMKFGHRDVAVLRYERLLALPNQENDFLYKLFRAWAYTGLATALKDSDPVSARAYVEQGLALGVTGGTREDLLRLQRELAPQP